MIVGIIGAMTNEVELIINSTKLIKEEVIGNINFYKLKYKDKDIILAKSGVGKVNASIAATILALNYHVDLIISTGIAGGMSPLKPRDICLVDKLYYGDVDATIFNYKFGQVPGEPEYYVTDEKLRQLVKNVHKDSLEVSSLTSDSFITSMPKLPSHEEIFCFEMESSAIAQTASHFSKPLLVIRYISDIVGLPSQIDDYAKFEDEIAHESALITLKVVEEL